MIRLRDLMLESPDSVMDPEGKIHNAYTTKRAVPFVYSTKLKKTFIGQKGEMHHDMGVNVNKDLQDKNPWQYSGRVFFAPKIVTTWWKIPPSKLKKILKDVERQFGLKIIGNGYSIENRPGMTKGPRGGMDRGKANLLPLDDYIK